MLSVLVGLSMLVSAEINLACSNVSPIHYKECASYLYECVLDGETVGWCEEDYTYYVECLKDSTKCH